VISICVLIFLGLLGFMFWVGGLAEKAGPVQGKSSGAPPAQPQSTMGG